MAKRKLPQQLPYESVPKGMISITCDSTIEEYDIAFIGDKDFLLNSIWHLMKLYKDKFKDE